MKQRTFHLHGRVMERFFVKLPDDSISVACCIEDVQNLRPVENA